jgi:hypothetical protein
MLTHKEPEPRKEREIEEVDNREVVRGTTYGKSKVPRQCPLVILAEAMHMIRINCYCVGRAAL